MSQPKHLVFYDGQCGFCDRTVRFLLDVDDKQQFIFAPLQGSTAAPFIQDLPPALKNADSLILVENYQSDHPQVYILSKAVFRICWLLGGAWTLLGWLCFLPSFLFDWGYRLVAQNRHRLFSKDKCTIFPKDYQDRFLP